MQKLNIIPDINTNTTDLEHLFFYYSRSKRLMFQKQS